MESAAGRRGRPRSGSRGATAGPPRTPRRGRRRRSPPVAAAPPSGGGALGALRNAPLNEELRVQLERVLGLLRDLVVAEDRVDRAGVHAGVAVDADGGVDVELLGGLEVGVTRLRVNAVDGTD